MKDDDSDRPERRSVQYAKSLQGLSKEGIVGHIAVCLAWWDTGRQHHDAYRGSQNDAQLILNILVRAYHRKIRPNAHELPSTQRGHAALRDGTGYVREHAIPVACVVWALMNEVQLMGPSAAIKVVQEVLDRTCLEAVIHKDEDHLLRPFQCTMPQEAATYEHWIGDAVWARYTKVGLDVPVLRD